MGKIQRKMRIKMAAEKEANNKEKRKRNNQTIN